ncbi:hypothetical protein M8C21_029642, partial [Ambrosia artemisiifolia]
RDLSLGTTQTIDRLDTPPTPLHFLRHYLSQNKPFILSPSFSSTLHWPATTLWSSTPYLLNTLHSTTVSLHRTPTGQADSLTPHPHTPTSLCFASADVTLTSFPNAVDSVIGSCKNNNGGCVGYLQQQNDCFRGEYGELNGDCDLDVGWATEAIGAGPEAVNLWIGNEMSETWFHKDCFENLYAVVTGEKHFLLLPPTDVHRMYVKEYPAAKYEYSEFYYVPLSSFLCSHTRPGSLKVLVYEGVKTTTFSSKHVPKIGELITADIVLTRYDVLREDISHDTDRA